MDRFRIGWQCNCSPRVYRTTIEAATARDASQLAFQDMSPICDTARVLTCEQVAPETGDCLCTHPDVVWGNVTRSWYDLNCGLVIPALDLEGCVTCGETIEVGQPFRVWRGGSEVFGAHDSCFVSLHARATFRSTRWPLMAHSKVHFMPARGFSATGSN